jgi:ABC-type phosphate transport system auxiliary subunit
MKKIERAAEVAIAYVLVIGLTLLLTVKSAFSFWPLIFIGQSNLIDCVRDEGVKDGCRSEEVLEGR